MRSLLVTLLALQLGAGPLVAAASAEDGGVRQGPPPASPAGAPEQAQASSADPPQGPIPEGALPVSMDRIKKALATEPTLKLELPIRDDIPRYYMEITGTPSFETFLENFDLANGPVPGASMTHREFLQQVTPKELYSQAGFGGLEMLTANLGFAAVMYLATKAFNAMREAKSERELEQIREQIRRELEELQKANAAKKRGGGDSRPPGSP